MIGFIRDQRRRTWMTVAAIVAVAGCVALPWILKTHPSNGNPWLHLPPPKDPDTKVSAGDDCGSYRPPRAGNDEIDTAETKIVVNRGSTVCGEATTIITIALESARGDGAAFPAGDGWGCTALSGTDSAVAGYRLKCQRGDTEVWLVPVMDRNAKDLVDNRSHRLPRGASRAAGGAYSFATPMRNLWCQIDLDVSGMVRNTVCQGELPPDAPLVDGVRANSVVLEAIPDGHGSGFAALDDRIVDFVPPLPLGSTIRVLSVECTATERDELACNANGGTPHEHGFTISARGYALR